MAGTVTVALKYPHGIIMRVFDMKDVEEPLPGGGTKTVQRGTPRNKTIKINGYLEKYDPSLPPAARGSSYALTHGVDKDFFDQWMKQNHDNYLVENDLIFAGENENAVKGKIKENEKRKCGLEPIDRDKLPRGISQFKKDAA